VHMFGRHSSFPFLTPFRDVIQITVSKAKGEPTMEAILGREI